MNGWVAIAMVGIAIAGVIGYVIWKDSQTRQQSSDPAALIGGGIGQLVQGIAGAAS